MKYLSFLILLILSCWISYDTGKDTQTLIDIKKIQECQWKADFRVCVISEFTND